MSAQMMKGSPAHLEVDAGNAVHAGVADLLAGLDRAGEGDAVDARVAVSAAHLAGARDQVDGAGRRVLDARGQHQGRKRVTSEGLQTVALPAASAGQASRPAAAGVVPGHDAAQTVRLASTIAS